MNIVGVVGAGVMGRGVAQNLAQVNIETVLIDLDEAILEKAQEEIYRNIRFQAFFKKEETPADPDQIVSRIKLSTELSDLAEADYVIENVDEIWETKKAVYEQLDKICKADCFFLVNTSCISITKLAAVTNRPEKIIGTHFMNPVPLKAAVETIKGYHTSTDTIEATKQLLARMGKEAIIVNDYPGFVSNRISHLFMNEAAFVVQDQVAAPEEVDEIFKKCFGHKMGPLETADLIGLDTVVNSLDVLYESYQDPKFRCCPLLRKLVSAGLYGRKSGKGFYTY